MLDVPADLTSDQIAIALRDCWGIAAIDVTYAAVGHGSCNWVVVADNGEKWFVKADDQPRSAERGAAYPTAAALHDAGLDFVHAAYRDRSGRLRRRIGPRWDVAVFPFLEGHNPDFATNSERAKIAEAVGRLHAHPVSVDGAVRWTTGGRQPGLRTLLANDLDQPWTGGPYGERARALVRASLPEIWMLLAEYDRLAEHLLASPDPWVITHGEPHGGNTMLDAAGRVHLIDCDDLMLAPRERDLWLLLYVSHDRPLEVDNTPILAAYRSAAGPAQPRPEILELFRADWHLRDISSHALQLRGSHEDTADVRAHWTTLNQYLPPSQNWSLADRSRER